MCVLFTQYALITILYFTIIGLPIFVESVYWNKTENHFFDIGYLGIQNTHFWVEPFFLFSISGNCDEFHVISILLVILGKD